MSSTITPATLTVTISEAIELNGQAVNSENTLELININEIDKRVMTIPTVSEVTVVSFGSAVAAGTFVRGDLQYFRVTNKDSVNYARIRVKKNGADTFDTLLYAGASFMMGSTLESVSATAASFASFVNADSINMQAFDDDIDVEYFVASSNL